jgi:type II secretory pathway component PulF
MEMVMEDNYLELALDEVYQLVASGVRWPESLQSSSQRKAFLRDMVEYYEEHEEYERCATLQEMIDELED